MNILVSGVNYKSTPLSIRERLSFDLAEQKRALMDIHKLPWVKECVMLCTCNRSEVYIYSEEGFDPEEIESLLCDQKGLKLYDLKKYFYTYTGESAARHLFRVTSGLDSMILGEDQILGQVKAAYHTALEVGTGSSVLNTLFRDAITAAKKIKTNTELSKGSGSVGSLAVKYAATLWGDDLKERCALLIGTGNMGSLVIKHLLTRGIGKIYITNRSHGKMEDISRIHPQVHLLNYEDRYSIMDTCDIVFSSTTSPHYTITRDRLEASLLTKKERLFIDLAVPRDLDVSINAIKGCQVFHMDQLQSVMDANQDRQVSEAKKAEEMLEEYIEEYGKIYEFRRALPVVMDIQRYVHTILCQKIEATLGKLKCASEEDKETVKASITHTVNEIMGRFIYSMKENGSREDIQIYYKYLEDIMKEDGVACRQSL